MTTEKRIPTRFRELLKQELAGWQRDALITSEQATALGKRYQLDELTRDSSRTLLLVIYIVGAALIGCGVISFVAWNWDAIPDAIKVIAALGLMLGCHAAGYRFWKVTGERQRLGHALVLLGTLLFVLAGFTAASRGSPDSADTFTSWPKPRIPRMISWMCIPCASSPRVRWWYKIFMLRLELPRRTAVPVPGTPGPRSGDFRGGR